MWSSERRRMLLAGALLVLAAGLISGCGFTPMYGEGAPASLVRGRVVIELPRGTPGFIMRERLLLHLGEAESASHYLEIDYDINVESVALTENNVQTRFRVVGAATFELRPQSGEGPVLRGEVSSTTGYSAPESSTGSAFATEMAEQAATKRVAEDMADRIALILGARAAEWVP